VIHRAPGFVNLAAKPFAVLLFANLLVYGPPAQAERMAGFQLHKAINRIAKFILGA